MLDFSCKSGHTALVEDLRKNERKAGDQGRIARPKNEILADTRSLWPYRQLSEVEGEEEFLVVGEKARCIGRQAWTDRHQCVVNVREGMTERLCQMRLIRGGSGRPPSSLTTISVPEIGRASCRERV